MNSTSLSWLLSARSYLFIPGDRPDRFDRAWDGPADALILDLEDAVFPERKDFARLEVQKWLDQSKPVWIRINAMGSKWFDEDVQLLTLPGVLGVVLPKAEEISKQLSEIAAQHNIHIIPLIETALGLHRSLEIAKSPGVLRLSFGSIDFQVDLGIDGDDEVLLFARSQLVMSSRLANIGSPVDGVTVNIQDMDSLHSDSERSRRLGFGAKFCIHPSQIETVHDCLSPSMAEREWAARVLVSADAQVAGAFTVDGKMVDLPVIKKARRFVAAPEANFCLRATSKGVRASSAG